MKIPPAEESILSTGALLGRLLSQNLARLDIHSHNFPTIERYDEYAEEE